MRRWRPSRAGRRDEQIDLLGFFPRVVRVEQYSRIGVNGFLRWLYD